MHVYLYWPNIGLMVKLFWNYLVETRFWFVLHEAWSFSSWSMKLLKNLLLILQDRKYFQITCWPSNLVTNTVYKLWKLPKNRLQFKCTARFSWVWKENKSCKRTLCNIFQFSHRQNIQYIFGSPIPMTWADSGGPVLFTHSLMPLFNILEWWNTGFGYNDSL